MAGWRRRLLVSGVIAVGAACSGSGTASTPPSSVAPTTVPPPPTTIGAPTTTASEAVAEELHGIISIAVQLDLSRPELDCVANTLPAANVQAVVSQGFFSITVEAQGQLFQAVARCASVQTQAQFGSNLVRSRGLSAKEAACVTKAFFQVLRTDLDAAEQATMPLVKAKPAVRDAVTAAIRPCLSSDKLKAFVQDSAAPATLPPNGG